MWVKITLITLGVLNLLMGLYNITLNKKALIEERKQNKKLRIDDE
jgi:hypothetical protein